MSKNRIKKRQITDDLELAVAESLSDAGILFTHSLQPPYHKLDFYLPEHDIYIEVKKFHTERVCKQLHTQENIILIQGRKSVEFMKKILKK